MKKSKYIFLFLMIFILNIFLANAQNEDIYVDKKIIENNEVAVSSNEIEDIIKSSDIDLIKSNISLFINDENHYGDDNKKIVLIEGNSYIELNDFCELFSYVNIGDNFLLSKNEAALIENLEDNIENSDEFQPIEFIENKGKKIDESDVKDGIKIFDDGISIIRLGNTSVKNIDGIKKINDLIYLPIRKVFNALGYGVSWNSYNNEIIVNKEHLNYNFNSEDILYLARIIRLETMDSSMRKKIAVANVVLNRINSGVFPDTIKGVIFQKGQFPPSNRANFNTFMPPKECFEAAKLAISGHIVLEDALYFNYIPFKNKAKDFIENIEGDYFYR